MCDSKFWVENNNGERFTLGQLFNSGAKTRSINELSRYLHIEAWTIQLRFQGKNFAVCSCHPDTAHGKSVERGDRWEELVLCERLTKNDPLRDRLRNQLWTCILIFGGWIAYAYAYNLIVVDWQGGVAHRIGAITLRDYHDDDDNIRRFSDIPKTRQRIRLA